MRYFRLLSLVVLLAVIALAAVSVSAQTGYGTTTPKPPACTANGADFSRLSDEDALLFVANLPAPTGADMVAVYKTACFGALTFSFEEEDVDCEDVVAYRVEVDGNQELWPTTCDPLTNDLTVPGTGLPGHIVFYSLPDPSDAPAGVPLSRGA